MDLKVSVDNIFKDVCGITESTTCEQIIYRLAQVASLPGFYTLVAKTRDGEITLSPEERIIRFIRETKENPANLRFILRRLEAPSPRPRESSAQYNPNFRQPPSAHTNAPRQLQTPLLSDSKNSISALPNWSTQKFPYSANGYASNHPSKLTTESEQTSFNPITGYLDTTNHELNQYNQLKDQLAYQEQQVELNRIRLLRLDKEIAQLEHSASHFGATKLNTTDQWTGIAFGAVAELAQLAATPWSQLMESNRDRHRELIAEQERCKLAIDHVNGCLLKAKADASNLENQIGFELNRLMNELETYNQYRRSILKADNAPGTSVHPVRSMISTPFDPEDGVAI